MSNPIPELPLYVGNAYNAKEGDFLSKPVFNITYNNANTILWGGSTVKRDVPDQISASGTTLSKNIQQTVLLETSADYDRVYSSTVDIQFSGVNWSGTSNSSYLYHGTLFQSSNKTYGLNYYIQQILAFQRLQITSSTALDANFVAAISALPTQVNTTQEQSAYFAFFDDYGTHYLTKGVMGGTIVMETDIDDSVLNSSNTTDIKLGLQLGFNGVVNSGTMNVTAAYNASDFMKSHQNNIQTSLNVMGGLYDSSASKISDWYNSLYITPSLLITQFDPKAGPLSSFSCISNLASIAVSNKNLAPTIAQNIVTMLSAYLKMDFVEDGYLTSPRQVQPNFVANASFGDGFVFGTLRNVAKDHSSNYAIAVEDDGTNNPSSVRASAAVNYSTSGDTIVPTASFFMPTRFKSAYNVRVPASSNVTASIYYVGLGKPQTASLGTWETIAMNSSIVAPSDGFVVASIDYNNDNGARGYIQGTLPVIQNGTVSSKVVAGASQHYYSDDGTYVNSNSFCMPVCKSQAYSVAFEKTSRTPAATGLFIPLSTDGSLAFSGPLQQRNEGTIYVAESDGFLLAYLHYGKNNGGRGYVNLYTFKNQDDPKSTETELMSLGLLGSTSVHQWSHDDTYVPINSVCIPVPKGNAYKAVLTTTSESPTVFVTWMPLVSTTPQ